MRAAKKMEAVYCSPRCGFGCTRASFDRATQEADALAKRLGAGWEPHVWENCGWRYTVSKGAATVTISGSGSFVEGTWVIESYSANITIEGVLQSFTYAPTPEDALGYAAQEVRTTQRRISDALATIIGDE